MGPGKWTLRGKSGIDGYGSDCLRGAGLDQPGLTCAHDVGAPEAPRDCKPQQSEKGENAPFDRVSRHQAERGDAGGILARCQ